MIENILAEIPAQNRLVSVAEMQALERAADAAGHSYAAMMEIAGRRVAETLLARYGRTSTSYLSDRATTAAMVWSVHGTCMKRARQFAVYLWKRRTNPDNDYEGHFGKLAALGVPAAHADDDPGFGILGSWLESSVLVDALLGTGTNRPIEGQLAHLLRYVDEFRRGHEQLFQILAVDCASGLNCDTGAVDPLTLSPDVTVTFAHAKVGQFKFPGADSVGELITVDIGVPADLSTNIKTFLIDEILVQRWLPTRPRLSHKGAFGKVLLAVGSQRFPGAAYLSCAAAGRVGAGLVTGARCADCLAVGGRQIDGTHLVAFARL